MTFKYSIIYPIVVCLFINNSLFSQELNCSVEVNSTQIIGSDKSIFDVLKKNVSEFVNNRKWTNHNYQFGERIECTMLINVTERVSTNSFKATIQVQSRRPIHNSSYNSPLINHIDKDFEFTFNEFEQLEYSENTFTSNLTSVISFYVYMILAIDYESFELNGGTPFFLKAQTLINNAQGASANGWKAFEDTKNRYWMVENHLKPNYVPFRETLYKYHRQGLDIMSSDVTKGRQVILTSLKSLESVSKYDPNSFQLQMFFNAKADEIVEIFKEAPMAEKDEVVTLLNKINPANSTTYEKIISGK